MEVRVLLHQGVSMVLSPRIVPRALHCLHLPIIMLILHRYLLSNILLMKHLCDLHENQARLSFIDYFGRLHEVLRNIVTYLLSELV